jgi:rhodanese-related sulfurtransferase
LSVEYSRSGFATRVGTIDPDSDPLAVVAASRPRGEDACRQLAEAGRVCLGVLLFGSDLLEAAPLTLQRVTEVWAADLYPDMRGDIVILDVREPIEWETGFVPGAVCIPLGHLPSEYDKLPRDRPVIVICEAGLRSATAASLLFAAGFSDVAHVPDGTAGYRRTGRALAFPKEALEGE